MKKYRLLAVISISISIFSSALPTGNAVAGQAARDLDKYLSHLPADLKLKENGPQKYSFICDYFTLDTKGDLLGKDRISGDYTRGLPEGKVRWTNVRIAQAKGLSDPFPQGALQSYMEGFTYKIVREEDLASKDFFAGFPPAEFRTKNLVWDTLMFESFAWNDFGKLSLNKPYHFLREENVNLAGAGNFKNNDVELTWTGISKRNGVVCALIRYEAFFNRLDISIANFNAKGRSHYWGEIWVSLETKQIEYGTLREDVLLETRVTGQPGPAVANVFREGIFQKQ